MVLLSDNFGYFTTFEEHFKDFIHCFALYLEYDKITNA